MESPYERGFLDERGRPRESTEYRPYDEMLLQYPSDSTGVMRKERQYGSRNQSQTSLGRMESLSEDEGHIVSREPAHKYLIRRPRALQFTYMNRVVRAAHGDGAGMSSNARGGEAAIEEHREKLDLFIDLIWVAIISNLTSVFSSIMFAKEESNPKLAVAVYLFVFMPSWRIWNFLREFVNHYYLDDGLQRVFLFWIFCMSMFYGNNVAFIADYSGRAKRWLIGSYLVIRGSFVLMELAYSFYIPWLRKLVLVQSLVSIPAVAFWVAAMFVRSPYVVIPVTAAILWEYIVTIIVKTPLGDRLTPSEYKKAVDPHHLVHRMSSFFIITIGEGVLLLIKDGPLGIGLGKSAPVGVWSLLIYFLLVLIYFNGDGSKTFSHAASHDGVRCLGWIFWHVPLFGAFLPLSASFLFLISDVAVGPQLVKSDPLPQEQIDQYTVYAVWAIATTLSTMVVSLAAISLCNESFDPPGTLLVNNRFLRMAPRLVGAVLIAILPIGNHISAIFYLGLVCALLFLIYIWEWVVSLERSGKVVEPKGVTALLKTEIKGGRKTSR